MKRSYVERAKKFVDTMAPYLKPCNNYDDVLYMVACFNEDFHRKVTVRRGATRMAFITSDYVVKVEHDPDAVAEFGGGREEYELYQLALKEGYAYLFAAITPYECGGLTYWIMPRIYGIGGSRNGEWDVLHFLNWDERCWVNDHVQDLHEYNYGWRDGHPVIIDYACLRGMCSVSFS